MDGENEANLQEEEDGSMEALEELAELTEGSTGAVLGNMDDSCSKI